MNNIEICRQKAVELLKNNSTPSGILACSPSLKADSRNYTSIFGRDAGICTLGMVLTEDQELIGTARKSLISLSERQAPNGQIPNYVKHGTGETDFWYLGCIDSTLWWLIAIKFYDRFSGNNAMLSKKLKANINKALSWLQAQEHQKTFLLAQNEASDWADIMPRSGFVLYSNALWTYIKRIYNLAGLDKTAESFNILFSPWQDVPKKYINGNRRAARLISEAAEMAEKTDYLLSYINYGDCGTEIDVFANILSCLLKAVPHKKARSIIRKLIDDKASRPYPAKSCLNPISDKSIRWKKYMASHNQNFPNQYHNGGIWPMVGGFWVMSLSEFMDRKTAQAELEKLAALNSQNNWEFKEWFHGKTAEPMGMSGQSWNAAMFIAAHQSLYAENNIFDIL